MRWSYKTVHYDYKKEGLLGGAFLDETEIEQSMNEFGRSGWELVSLFESHDGLIAIFKQPLDLPARQGMQPAIEADEGEKTVMTTRTPRPEKVQAPPRTYEPVKNVVEEEEDEPNIPVSAPQTFRPVPTKTEKKRPTTEEEANGGVGSIRIE